MGTYYVSNDTNGTWKRVNNDISNGGFDVNGIDDKMRTKYRRGSGCILYTIPTEAQSQYCRLTLYMNLQLDNSSGGGVQATRCGSYFKGLDIIATRPLSQQSMGSSAESFVSGETYAEA